MEPNETFKLKVDGPHGLDLSVTVKGTILNDDEAAEEEEEGEEEEEEDPAPTTTPELTVSSPSATEGGDLNFTVTLSGTSGLVSLNVRPVSASASNPGRDYEPPSVSSLSRQVASGGSFTFPVETIRGTVEEGSETLEMHASVSAGGLSAYGTGTILDRGAPPSTPSMPGGWSGTGDCDAGILLVRGEANERAGQLPVWLPRIPADEDVRVHYWFRRRLTAAACGQGRGLEYRRVWQSTASGIPPELRPAAGPGRKQSCMWGELLPAGCGRGITLSRSDGSLE